MSGTANNPIERIAFNVRDFITQPLVQNSNDMEPPRFDDLGAVDFPLRPTSKDARLPNLPEFRRLWKAVIASGLLAMGSADGFRRRAGEPGR